MNDEIATTTNDMTTTKKTIRHLPAKTAALVVGAGPSGLAALKELREAGIDAISVDARDDFGGVFSPSSGVTYEDLYLTTTNMFMAFSDFPPEDRTVRYWSKDEYYRYLRSYVGHFGLGEHMHLGTTVLKAALVGSDGDASWHVTLKAGTGETVDLACDHLTVATGANHAPHLPAAVREGFRGEILHSREYRSPEQVRGKNVLVIGTGESSADAVASSVRTAASVAVWSRRYPSVAPRFLTECLEDTEYNECELLPTQGKHRTRKPGEFLEAITTSRIVGNMPLAAWATVLQKGLFADLTATHGAKSAGGLKADWCASRFTEDFFSADRSSAPTKTLMMCTAAAARRANLVVAPRVRFGGPGGRRVVFEEPVYHGLEKTDGREKTDLSIDVDVIIACTGYELSFDWIKVPGGFDTNPRYWFKHCFPTEKCLVGKLAFLGYARPHQGGIPQCAEMLSRYVAQLIAKNAKLPDNFGDIALVEGKCEQDSFHLSKGMTVLVDYPPFMLSVARLVGCEPAIPRTLDGMVKYWTFPLWTCFFRTGGVGAKPQTCADVLDRFGTFDGVAPMPLAAVQVVLTFLTPFLNLASFLYNSIFERRRGSTAGSGLPAAYKFRMSKIHPMSGNDVRLSDLGAPVLVSWIAALAMIANGASGLFAAGHKKITP